MNPQEEIKLMLEQALEIQEGHKLTVGDTFIQDENYFIIGNASILYKIKPDDKLLEPLFDGLPVPIKQASDDADIIEAPAGWKEAKRTWYPSIEQLQNMINMKDLQITSFYEEEKFYCRITSASYKVHDEFLNAYTNSILWLKIVMYVKYKKYWNENLKVWTTELSEED
jgi:hypothetical protein